MKPQLPSSIIRRTLALLLAFTLTAIGVQAQEFEPIGGPYEPDSATVLLMHFEQNLANESDSTADGQRFGNTVYVPHTSFPQGPGEELGTALYIENDSPTDSSYVLVPDTTSLDLTGSWTMELWVNIFTFGDVTDDHRWQPRIMFKPGGGEDDPDGQFYNSNYYITMWGGPRHFKTGYYTDGAGWTEIQSPNQLVNTQTWYHVTFIRDTTKHVIVQMLHDADGNLLHFDSEAYNPISNHPPRLNPNPLYIGTVPGQGRFWLDGLVDEIRISNVVRNFPVPPIITGVTQADPPPPDEPVEIKASIETLGEAGLSSAQLHYRVDGGAFQTVDMTQQADSFAATIPGQSSGSVINYYVEAQINDELRSVSPTTATPSDPDAEPSYYTYAIIKAESKVLHLTFDEGTGTPVDHGEFEVPVQAFGLPQYVEGKVGDHAFYFDGDSTYLAVPAPERAFLNSREFAIDLWFNADTILASQTRWIMKEGASNAQDFNYQIWSPGGGRAVPAAYVPGQETGGSRTGGLTGLDSTYTPGEWYRIVYVMMEDTTFSRFYDADDQLIQEVGGPIEAEVHLGGGPFHIGAYSGVLDSEGNVQPDAPVFQGMMDDIQVYNYVPEAYQPSDTTATATDDPAALPERVTLAQNYPNPFNPSTTIQYVLPHADRVSLGVYDVLGRKVATLVDDERKPAGAHEVQFDASSLASGVYFYRLDAGNKRLVQKMMLVK